MKLCPSKPVNSAGSTEDSSIRHSRLVKFANPHAKAVAGFTNNLVLERIVNGFAVSATHFARATTAVAFREILSNKKGVFFQQNT